MLWSSRGEFESGKYRKMIRQLKLEFLNWSIPGVSYSRSLPYIFRSVDALGIYSYAERKAGEQVMTQFKYTYESKSYFNGPDFALYSVMFSSAY